MGGLDSESSKRFMGRIRAYVQRDSPIYKRRMALSSEYKQFIQDLKPEGAHDSTNHESERSMIRLSRTLSSFSTTPIAKTETVFDDFVKAESAGRSDTDGASMIVLRNKRENVPIQRRRVLPAFEPPTSAELNVSTMRALQQPQRTQRLRRELWEVQKRAFDVCEDFERVKHSDSLVQVSSLLEGVPETEDHKDCAALLLFCEYCKRSYGSLVRFLSAISTALVDPQNPTNPPLPISIDFFNKYTHPGLHKNASERVWSIVANLSQSQKGGIYPNDFLMIHKPLSNTLLRLHEWAANIPRQIRKQDNLRSPTFLPCRIWLFPNASNCLGLPFDIRKNVSLEIIFKKIEKDLPRIVPFGAKIRSLWEYQSRSKILKCSEFKNNCKYLVCDTIAPKWHVVAPVISRFQI